jgi:hypothetical protein
MEFQAKLANYVLTNAICVLSERARRILHESNTLSKLEDIFKGRIVTVRDEFTGKSSDVDLTDFAQKLDFKNKESNQHFYYVFLSLSDANTTESKKVYPTLYQYPWCVGCKFIFAANELSSCLNNDDNVTTPSKCTWFCSQIMNVLQVHFSWNKMMDSDELMEDPEYRTEILEAVLEEFSEFFSINIPPTYELYVNAVQTSQHKYLEYLTKIWKMSHSFKTTARLICGNKLELQSSLVCSCLRPVVRDGVHIDSLQDRDENVYSNIKQFADDVKMLHFLVEKLLDLLHM